MMIMICSLSLFVFLFETEFRRDTDTYNMNIYRNSVIIFQAEASLRRHVSTV